MSPGHSPQRPTPTLWQCSKPVTLSELRQWRCRSPTFSRRFPRSDHKTRSRRIRFGSDGKVWSDVRSSECNASYGEGYAKLTSTLRINRNTNVRQTTPTVWYCKLYDCHFLLLIDRAVPCTGVPHPKCNNYLPLEKSRDVSAARNEDPKVQDEVGCGACRSDAGGAVPHM